VKGMEVVGEIRAGDVMHSVKVRPETP
jgi:hypothetical protein